MNEFDWAGKSKPPACKTLRVWTKNEEHFEKFQEKVEIFDQNLSGKLTFSQLPTLERYINWHVEEIRAFSFQSCPNEN